MAAIGGGIRTNTLQVWTPTAKGFANGSCFILSIGGVGGGVGGTILKTQVGQTPTTAIFKRLGVGASYLVGVRDYASSQAPWA